jgi:hypothetical protein
MANGNQSIILLVFCLGIAGLISLEMQDRYRGEIGYAVAFATIFAQPGLLGIGAALAPVLWFARLGWAVVGLAWVVLELMRIQGDGRFLLVIALLTFVIVLACGVMLRTSGISFFRPRNEVASPPRLRFRFTMQQLMMFTALVALLSATYGWLRNTSLDSVAGLLIASAVTFAASTLLGGVIAVFPRQRVLLVAIAFPLAVGLSLPLMLFNPYDPKWLWPMVTVLQAAIVGVSLHIVQSCGYRLCSTHGSRSSEPTSGQGPSE